MCQKISLWTNLESYRLIKEIIPFNVLNSLFAALYLKFQNMYQCCSGLTMNRKVLNISASEPEQNRCKVLLKGDFTWWGRNELRRWCKFLKIRDISSTLLAYCDGRSIRISASSSKCSCSSLLSDRSSFLKSISNYYLIRYPTTNSFL